MKFWPLKRWKVDIPHPSGWRRWKCKLTGGHQWEPHWWKPSSKEEPNYPQYDYCYKCWKFKDRDNSKDV